MNVKREKQPWEEKPVKALFNSIRLRKLDGVISAFESGLDANTTDQWKFTSAVWAVRKGWTELASYLVSKAAQLDTRDHWMRSPLHHCILYMDKKGTIDVARIYVKAGAPRDAKDQWGKTPFDRIPASGYYEKWLNVLRP